VLKEFFSRKLIARYIDLYKIESAIIIQARSNRIKFANFLYKTRVLNFETPRYSYELTNEIPKYIFIEYNRFRYIRNFFRNNRN
jgi:predicted transglutaminase-like protease